MIKASNNPFDCTPVIIAPGGGTITPFKQELEYEEESVTLTSPAKVLDVQNLTNPSKSVGWTVIDSTHITIDSNCEEGDSIKIIGTQTT